MADLSAGEYRLVLTHINYLETGELELWFSGVRAEDMLVVRFKPSLVEIREVEK